MLSEIGGILEKIEWSIAVLGFSTKCTLLKAYFECTIGCWLFFLESSVVIRTLMINLENFLIWQCINRCLAMSSQQTLNILSSLYDIHIYKSLNSITRQGHFLSSEFLYTKLLFFHYSLCSLYTHNSFIYVLFTHHQEKAIPLSSSVSVCNFFLYVCRIRSEHVSKTNRIPNWIGRSSL